MKHNGNYLGPGSLLIDKALAIHTAVSVELFRELKSMDALYACKKSTIRTALDLIEELDVFVDAHPEAWQRYEVNLRRLFLILKELRLEDLIKEAVLQQCGPQSMLFESLLQ